ncbi:MAG: flagellar basal body P-ring formation protein FlgA [Burkholderiales bacterium]|nr:flagellar basal body P-ring formation protein FlgA [Burkholderiales bacterium]
MTRMLTVRHLLLHAAVALTLGSAVLPARAATQDLDAIRMAAEDFVRRQTATMPGLVSVELGAIDTRLQLPACGALHPFLPPGGRLWGRSNIGIRCNAAPESWSIMVPVTVRLMGDAVFVARPLVRGQPVTDADVTVRQVDLTEFPAGVIRNAESAVGKVPQVSVAAGLALRTEMLRGAFVVTQGQSVTVVFIGDGFRVSSEGRALGNGAVGEHVSVRTASGRTVRGLVTGPATIEVK